MVHFVWKIWMRLKNPSCTIRSARLGKKVELGKHVTLEYGGVIAAESIGDYTFINKYALIDGNVKSIGKFCSIAYNVRIGLGGHPTNWVSTHPFAYEKKYGFAKKSKSWTDDNQNTIIGNDVWIGANSTILAGVKIGDGAIIGAHSLVKEDVQPYSIVVGTPAKHIRYRHDKETVDKLLGTEWWNLPKDQIVKRLDSMDNLELFLDSFEG